MSNEQIKLNDEKIKELSYVSSTGLTREEEDKIVKYVQDNPIEIYWDYRDELSKEQIEEIFADTSTEEKLMECVWSVQDSIMDMNLDYSFSLETEFQDQVLKEFDLEDIEDDRKESLYELIRDNIVFDWNFDKLFSKSSVNVVVTAHSNYDCLSSDWAMESTYEYYDSYFGDMLDFLNINPAKFKEEVDKIDYLNTGGEFPDLPERNDKEVIKIEDLLQELNNNTSPSNYIFITRMPVDEAIEFFKEKEKAEYVLIKKDTISGLFSHFQGGGSLLECYVKQDSFIKIKTDKSKHTCLDIEVEPVKHYYTVADVYGIYNSEFERGGIDLIERKGSKECQVS